jgi:hypothetical protein
MVQVAGSARWDSSFEQMENLLGWSRQYGSIVLDDDGALHELGVIQQEADDLLRGLVVGLHQAKLCESLVLADKVGWGILQAIEKSFEFSFRWWSLQVQHDLDLSSPFLENPECASRVAARRVVIDPDVGHLASVTLRGSTAARQSERRRVSYARLFP